MGYLTMDELLAIHERILEETRGSSGIRDAGLLHAAIEKPKTAVFGSEMYPTIYEKVAVLMEALVNYHGFVDGNKRTAVVASGVFLRANGFLLRVEQDDLVRFAVEIALKKQGISAIAAWLKRHSKRV
jgi:death-on-curing protein